MDSLKPCPFCGGEAIRERYYNKFLIECEDCEEYGHGSYVVARTEAEAIAAWNTRADRTCELHDCEGSFSAVNKPVWRCDCGAFMTQYTDATTYHKPRYCPNCGAKVMGE